MELEVMAMSSSSSSDKCCNCGCICSLNNNNTNNSLTWLRSVKRKFEEIEGGRQDVPTVSNAKVEMENECVALRETLNSQQQTIQELYTELDEERNASSSAANEAMSMILRLQREKAEIQMEARQFKRFAEERMAHDEQERCALEDVLYKREQTIQSLTCEVQAYKHRMLSYGLSEDEVEGEIQKSFHSRSNSLVEHTDAQFEFTQYDYPPLKCNMNETPEPLDYEDVADVEKYAFGETPRTGFGETPRSVYSDTHRYAFGEVPRTAYGETPRILEKTVVGQSPRRSRHIRRFSNDSSSSFSGFVKDMGQDYSKENPRPVSSFKKAEYFSHTEDGSNLRKMECASDPGDDMSDRVYTIDSIHHGTQYNTGSKAAIGICEDYVTTPRESFNLNDIGDTDIKKLCMRIQLLEADKESMKQALLSMRTDKAQMILLKEIAQHLYKDMTPERRMPVKKPSLVGSFSFISTLKVYVWTVSQQYGLIVASGQGTPFETVEMSYKGTNVKTVADKKRNCEGKKLKTDVIGQENLQNQC